MNLQQEYEEAAVFWEKVDTDAKKMPGEAVQKALDQFLGTHRLCVLATACRKAVRSSGPWLKTLTSVLPYSIRISDSVKSGPYSVKERVDLFLICQRHI